MRKIVLILLAVLTIGGAKINFAEEMVIAAKRSKEFHLENFKKKYNKPIEYKKETKLHNNSLKSIKTTFKEILANPTAKDYDAKLAKFPKEVQDTLRKVIEDSKKDPELAKKIHDDFDSYFKEVYNDYKGKTGKFEGYNDNQKKEIKAFTFPAFEDFKSVEDVEKFIISIGKAKLLTDEALMIDMGEAITNIEEIIGSFDRKGINMYDISEEKFLKGVQIQYNKILEANPNFNNLNKFQALAMAFSIEARQHLSAENFTLGKVAFLNRRIFDNAKKYPNFKEDVEKFFAEKNQKVDVDKIKNNLSAEFGAKKEYSIKIADYLETHKEANKDWLSTNGSAESQKVLKTKMLEADSNLNEAELDKALALQESLTKIQSFFIEYFYEFTSEHTIYINRVFDKLNLSEEQEKQVLTIIVAKNMSSSVKKELLMEILKISEEDAIWIAGFDAKNLKAKLGAQNKRMFTVDLKRKLVKIRTGFIDKDLAKSEAKKAELETSVAGLVDRIGNLNDLIAGHKAEGANADRINGIVDEIGLLGEKNQGFLDKLKNKDLSIADRNNYINRITANLNKMDDLNNANGKPLNFDFKKFKNELLDGMKV